MAAITTVEEWSTFADGSEYFSKTWHQRGSLKATVLFIHGLGEHIGRYDHVFPSFAVEGIRVLGWDQRGFGRTGRRGNAILGHNGGEDQALADIAQVDARARSKGVPHFVMGHSMGGGLALKYVSGALAKGGIDGLIASAPLVEPGSKTKPSIIEYYAVLALSKILRTVVMDNHVDEKELSRDPVAVKAYLGTSVRV